MLNTNSEISSDLFNLSQEDDLRNYLARNIKIIDPSLKVLNDGKKFKVPPIGEIDILCNDTEGNFVVIKNSNGVQRVSRSRFISRELCHCCKSQQTCQ